MTQDPDCTIPKSILLDRENAELFTIRDSDTTPKSILLDRENADLFSRTRSNSAADKKGVRFSNTKEEMLSKMEGFEIPEPQVRGSGDKPTPKETLEKGEGSVHDRMPDYMKEMFEKSITGLTSEQAEEFGCLLLEFVDVFAKHDLDLGCMKGVEHHINTGDHPPVKQKLRRTPLGFEAEEEKHLQKLLDGEVITPSVSEWASPTVLVRKPDRTIRYCIDFRKLNDRTIKDSYPLPLIEDCLDTLAGTVWLSIVDMANGYYQIMLSEESKAKTAFLTRWGLFQHERMGFGLCNAPATFQRAMMLVLRGLTWKEVLAYLDDIIILGKSFADHLLNLRLVFERFRSFNLKLKPKKCVFFRKEVPFLGKIVTEKGIQIAPKKIEAVREWPIPKTKSELSTFMGFASYHRNHIAHFAEITACLSAMTGARVEFKWTEEHQKAFEALKQALTTAPCLAYPKPDEVFILDTDASDVSIGAVLSQIQDGEEVVISYASNILIKEQRRWCTTRKELLAIVKFARYFRHYLLGRRFLIRTDHNCLVWLMSFKNPEGQLARWLEELAQYDFEILHRKGKLHSNADGVSRIPTEESVCDCFNAGMNLESLPCYPCKFCAKAQAQWGKFLQDVDDVIPLAWKSSGVAVRLAASASNVEDSQETQDLTDSMMDSPAPENIDDTLLPAASNWLAQYTFEELSSFQKDDRELSTIIRWLNDKVVPSSHELHLQSPAIKHLWMCRAQLQFRHGVLFYHWDNRLDKKLVFMVPKSKQEEVLEFCHDMITAGHLGEHKTLCRVKGGFLWYGMSKDVKLYVSTCRVCSMSKKSSRTSRAGMKIHHAGYPMERVHIDLLGPFVESNGGNKYILVMIDQFSKWIECAAIPDQQAETVAQQFLNHFVVTFGCPLEIHSDQGKQFDGNLFKAFCKLLQISKTRTTPYHPSSNGQVERYNRLILQMVRCFVGKYAKDWDKYLPLLVMATHAMEHRETGFTPNQLMLGREVMMPEDILMGIAQATKPLYAPSEWVKVQCEVIPQIYELVRKNLRGTLRRRKRDYDLRVLEKHFNIGDFIYLKSTTTKTGSKALTPVWQGPFLVISSNPPLYKIEDRKCRSKTLHHDRLKLCNDRVVPMWIRRRRHALLDLDTTIGYDELEQSALEVEPSQEENRVEGSEGAGESKVSDSEEILHSQGGMGGSSDPQDSVDLDETLPYSQGEPKNLPISKEFNEWLEEGILAKLFKEPRKPKKVHMLGLPSQLPSSRGRNRKAPGHLGDYVC